MYVFINLHNQPDPEDVHQHNCHIEDYLPAPQLHFLQPPVEKHLDHRKRNKISLPLILNYRFLDKPSVAMEIAGSNLNQMKGSMGKGKGESLWPLTSHLSLTFYTGVYKILFNLQYWLVSFLSVLYAGEYVLSSVYWVCKPFNSHEWPRQNFSLQYLYKINQISDKNKEKYQFKDYKLIQY